MPLMRGGSWPSQSGCSAVPSKIDVVLKGSYSPRDAAVSVFFSNDWMLCSSSGRKVLAATQAWSRMSIPVITADVGVLFARTTSH
jgi:hypothetical protein